MSNLVHPLLGGLLLDPIWNMWWWEGVVGLNLTLIEAGLEGFIAMIWNPTSRIQHSDLHEPPLSPLDVLRGLVCLRAHWEPPEQGKAKSQTTAVPEQHWRDKGGKWKRSPGWDSRAAESIARL